MSTPLRRPPSTSGGSAGDGDGDLLEAGDELAFRPSRRWIVVALVIAALVAVVPRVLRSIDERRERAATAAAEEERRRTDDERAAAEQAATADRVALEVEGTSIEVQGGHTGPDANAVVVLGMTLRNRAGAVRVESVTLTPPGMPPIDVRHPGEISERGEAELLATVRARCASVLQLPDGDATLELVVVPESGRRRVVELAEVGETKLHLRHGCGLQPASDAATTRLAFVDASPRRLRVVITVDNFSARPLTVLGIEPDGLSIVASPVTLPRKVAAQASVRIPLTLRVSACTDLELPPGELRGMPTVRLVVRGFEGDVAEIFVSPDETESGPSVAETQQMHAFLKRACPELVD